MELNSAGKISVAAAMTLPRVGFVENFGCILRGLGKYYIPLATTGGVFWTQGITRAISAQLERNPSYILTVDYDTVWSTEEGSDDLAKMVCLLEDHKDWDVCVPMQQKRDGGEILAHTEQMVNLNYPLVPIDVGHFGLTLFRASVFSRIEKPWFMEKPDPNGEWGEERTDADISFWHNCKRNSILVGLAPDVVIGHLEQVVTYPNQERESLFVPIGAWNANHGRPPANAFKRQSIDSEYPEAALTMRSA